MDLRAAKADWKCCVLCLHQDKNVVQKQNGVAWSQLVAHPESLSMARLSVLLVIPSHGLFSKMVFLSHLKKLQSIPSVLLPHWFLCNQGEYKNFPNARKVTQPKCLWLILCVSISSSTNRRNQYLLESPHCVVS